MCGGGSCQLRTVDALTQLLIWVQDQDMYRVPMNAGPELMELGGSDGDFGSLDGDPWGAT